MPDSGFAWWRPCSHWDRKQGRRRRVDAIGGGDVVGERLAAAAIDVAGQRVEDRIAAQRTEVATAKGVQGYRRNESGPKPLLGPLIIRKEEELIAPDRPAEA